MDKLELTETLRIYLPGLYFAMVIHYLTGVHISNASIAILAIFIGLIINSFHIAELFYLIYVEKFHGNFLFPKIYKHNLFVERKNVFMHKFDKILKLDDPVLIYVSGCEKDSFKREENILSKAIIAFDSGRHHNEEIKQMRLLSTLGHLKFLLCVISFISCVISLLNYLHVITLKHFVSKFSVGYLDFCLLFIACIVFFHGSIKDKKLSLKYEVGLYKNYSEEELKK